MRQPRVVLALINSCSKFKRPDQRILVKRPQKIQDTLQSEWQKPNTDTFERNLQSNSHKCHSKFYQMRLYRREEKEVESFKKRLSTTILLQEGQTSCLNAISLAILYSFNSVFYLIYFFKRIFFSLEMCEHILSSVCFLLSPPPNPPAI